MKDNLLYIFGVTLWLCSLSASGAEPVKYQLQFDWPEDYEARITYERTRASQQDTQPLQQRVEGAYWLFAKPWEGGHEISFHTMALRHAENPPSVQDSDALENHIDKILRDLPRYRVSAEGQFLALLDPDTLNHNIHQSVSELLQNSSADVKNRYTVVLDKLLAPANLSAKIAYEWANKVGLWAGKQLEVGKEYVIERQLSVPLLGPEPIAVVSRYRIHGEVSCHQKPQPLRCIEIQMSSSPAEDDMKVLEQHLFGGLVVRSLEIVSEYRLVTEPTTLIPHRSERTLIIRHAGVEGVESSRSSSKSELREFRAEVYQYPR